MSDPKVHSTVFTRSQVPPSDLSTDLIVPQDKYTKDAKLLQDLVQQLRPFLQLGQLGQMLARETTFRIYEWEENRSFQRRRVKSTTGDLGWGVVLKDKLRWPAGTITGDRLLLFKGGRLFEQTVEGEYQLSAGTATVRQVRLEEIAIEDAAYLYRVKSILVNVKDQIHPRRCQRKWCMRQWIALALH